MKRFFASGLSLLALTAAALSAAAPAAAETNQLRLTQQFGLSYLPLIVAADQKLFEKHAAAAGISDLKVSFTQLSGGAAINDALLAGAVDFGAAGLGPAFTAWDKTRGNADIRIAAALDRTAIYLTTNNPAVKSLKDFSEKDKIAVPAVKVSIQSVLLQIAAEKTFGPGQHDALDKYTVSLKHPDATAAILGGTGDVTAHFGQPPYSQVQLQNPKVKLVLTSNDILGGPASLNVLYATGKFRKDNPKLFASVIAALKEADAYITAHKAEAAKIFVDKEKPGVDAALVEAILKDEQRSGYDVAPKNTLPIAQFLYKTGAIKANPQSWKDYSFPELHTEAGS